MQKLTATLFCLFLSFHAAFCQTASNSQTASIKGKVVDTTESKSLANSSVLLLSKADSMLIGHTRADKDGNFVFDRVQRGQYLLMITYPSYADYVDELEIKDSTPLILPPINLQLRSKLLEAVVVRGEKGAIRIKGDTAEFTADSFRTQAGATVEDLLKRLPGIQVDKNGKITAQGETVQKVLVDGEEFFGDDPTLVTQNLRADMVDKVQVYDKKSDQAAFTGIDDGQRTKTINLKLKDNAKNGYFGRGNAGVGTDGYYDYQLMLNAFKKKQKFAGYGIISNTGKTGLNWQERDNYGQSLAGLANVDEASGGISIDASSLNDLDSWNGQFTGQGLPVVKTGGLHYNDKWDDDKQSLNLNYKFMQLNITDSSNTKSESILHDTVQYTNQRQQSNNQVIRHSANMTYDVKFDSTSSLRVQADGGADHKNTSNVFFSETRAGDSSLINQNNRSISTTGDNRVVNSNLIWRKKLPKKGRTLSVNFRENYTNNATSGYLYSNTDFYTKGSFDHDSVVDQYKSYQTENTLIDTRVTYTEPMSLYSFLAANYGVAMTNAHSDRNSFNKASNNKYNQLDTLYSNDYQFNTLTQSGGLTYSMIKKKFRFSFGNNIGFTNFTQRDLRADTSARRNFINWYPNASFAYNFSQQKRVSLFYNGSTVQPTVQQIQPVATNEDPLNINVGNPALKPQFQNQVYLNFSDYKVLTDRSIWVNIGYNFTQDAISTEVDVDTSGKHISRSINVDGNYNLNANIYYNLKWRKPDLRIQAYTNINEGNNVSVVNSLRNVTSSGSYRFGVEIGKVKEKIYSVWISGSAAYTSSRSSINTGVPTDYWTYEVSPSLDLFLPLKFQIHADGDINLRPPTAVFTGNNNVALLNAWVGKKFLKNDVLLLKLSGNDILNQNIGFNRSVNSNFISQNTYVTIKRYFMLSVVWNFSKPGTAVPGR